MLRGSFRRLARPVVPVSRFSSPHYPFDSVYCINLDRRSDRWAHTQQQLAKAGLQDCVRFSGIDGTTDVDVKQLEREGKLSPLAVQRLQLPKEEKLFGMDLTPGAIGCALSHRAVWRRIVEAQHQCCLILEDDVEFHPAIRRQFGDRWSRVPAAWELVYLGGLDLLSSDKPPRPYLAGGVRYAYQGHRELTAYVLHAKSAARCLELSEELTWQIDTHICNIFKEDAKAQDKYISDPLSYVLQPSLAIQVTKYGTDVQKQLEDNPSLTDASRRMREFVGGGTSKR
jgi:GR25 family glycosyltransferase involved in LPS biosynthesis